MQLLDEIIIEMPEELPSFDLPEWIDEFTQHAHAHAHAHSSDDDDETLDFSSSTSRPHQQDQKQLNQSSQQERDQDDTNQYTPLECLSADVTAYILSFHKINEIMNFALVSRKCHGNGYQNETTWKLKFMQRWNAAHIVDPIHSVYDDDDDDGIILNDGVSASKGARSSSKGTTSSSKNNGAPSSAEQIFWLRVYKAAYSNPHDLWMTHWNIVEPIDAVSSGRCCVPDITFKPRSKKGDDGAAARTTKGKKVVSETDREGGKCPTCRYHPLLDGAGVRVLQDAIHDEMIYAKSESIEDGDDEGVLPTPTDDDDDDDDGNIVDPVLRQEALTAGLSLLLDEGGNGDFVGTTLSEVIRHSTQYSLAKWCRRMRSVHQFDLSKQTWEFDTSTRRPGADVKRENNNDNDVEESNVNPPLSPFMTRRRQEAVRAFEKASTFHREVDASQFRSSGLNFLTDALFFPIEPSHKRVRRLDGLIRTEVDREELRAKKENFNWRMSETEHAILDLFGTPYHGEETLFDERWDAFGPLGPGTGSGPTFWPPAPLMDPKYFHAFDVSG